MMTPLAVLRTKTLKRINFTENRTRTTHSDKKSENLTVRLLLGLDYLVIETNDVVSYFKQTIGNIRKFDHEQNPRLMPA